MFSPILKWLLSPNLQPEAWGDFSSFFTVRTSWENRGKTHKNDFGGLPKTGFPGIFISQSCWHGASSNSSIPVPVLLPSNWFLWSFCWWASALVRCAFLYPSVCLCSGGGSSQTSRGWWVGGRKREFWEWFSELFGCEQQKSTWPKSRGGGYLKKQVAGIGLNFTVK